MGNSPVRSERQLTWQLTAARLLADLLAQAAGRRLPAVAWEIGEIGPCLTGYCHAPSEQRRKAFDAWYGYLGATRPADRLAEDHVGHWTLLIAQWNRYQGVQVTLRAEIDGPLTEEQRLDLEW